MTKPASSGATRRRKPKHSSTRLIRKSVLKMLTVMSEADELIKQLEEEFLTTGRAGRRNALPNIMSDHALTSTADLPGKLSRLTTSDEGEGESKKSDDDKEKNSNEPQPGPSSASS